MRVISSDHHYLREVELALINAPFGGDWRCALDSVARACRSQGSNLISLGGALPSLNILTGYDEAAFQDAFADPALWGQANWRVGTSSVPFQIQHDGHYADYRQRHATGRYDEVVGALGMPFGCQTIFAQDETGFLGLALMRTEAQRACEPETIARFDRLCRVTARSIQVEATLAGQGASLALGEMESIDKAIILLNRHGWRCAMTPEADAMLTAGWPVQSARERIRLHHPGDNYRFQQLLAFLLAAPPSAMMNASIVTQGWRVQMTHLPTSIGQLAFEANLALTILPLGGTERPGED